MKNSMKNNKNNDNNNTTNNNNDSGVDALFLPTSLPILK